MGLRLTDHDLEAAQVQVAGGPLGDVTVGVQAVRLLVVEGEVLDGDSPPRVRLDAAVDASGHAPGQQRVLGHVLEVASAQDGAVQVEGRGQPQVGTEVVHLRPDQVAVGGGQLGVPGLGDGGADRDGGGVLLVGALRGARLGGVATERGDGVVVHEFGEQAAQRLAEREGPIGVHAHLRGQAQARGAVGHDQRGQSLEAGGGLAGGADECLRGLADDRLLVSGVRVLAQDDVGQFVVGKGLHVVEGLGQVHGGLSILAAQVGGGHGQPWEVGRYLDGDRCGRLEVGEAGVAEGVVELADDGGLRQFDDGGGHRVAAGGAHAHHVVAGLQDGGGPGGVEGGDVGQVEGDGDLLGGAGGELAGLGEGGQGLVGLVEVAGGHGHVDLDDLLARAGAGVGDGGLDGDLGAGDADHGRTDGEGGVAQAVAEGEDRGGADGVEVAVADVYALAVVGVVRVAEVALGGVVLPGGPGGGELAGGVALAEQDVGEGVTDRGTQLGQQQDVLHVLDRAQVDDAADVEHQQELLELRGERGDVADLRVG